MPSIVCIVGKSKAGKTELIERLIAEFKHRGYRVATIKHSIHEFELNQVGKDSWRHAQAGSDAVVIISPQKLAMTKKVDHDLSVEELNQVIGINFDIVLAEGFRQSKRPKIEVHRKELGELFCDPRELIAVVTDEPLEADVPQFSFDDTSGLAELIEKKLLTKKEEETLLSINGKPIPLSPFPQRFLSETIMGMVSALKEVEEPKTIDISIKRKRAT
jgi:molybdopterin-guanine dinucleotide biosynthesis protein MobB